MSAGAFARALAGLGLAVAGLLVGTRSAGLFWTDRPHRPDLETLELKERLARAFAAPRVLLVGGSNIVFSTDSVGLSRALGTPVVNLGFSGLLGLAFMLSQAERLWLPGDTVILSPEYWLFLGGAWGDPQFLADAALVRPAWLRDMATAPQLRRLADGLGTFDHRLVAWAGGRRRGSYRYLPGGFNAHGDEVRHHSLPDGSREEKLGGGLPSDCTWDPAGARLINAFADRAAAAGIRVALVSPVFARPEYERHRERISALSRTLTADLRVPVLDRPEDGVFEVDDLFDSVNHLNARSIPVRTRHLADVIGTFLRAAPQTKRSKVP